MSEHVLTTNGMGYFWCSCSNRRAHVLWSLNEHITEIQAEAQATAEHWLERLESAVGFGPLADVADHQRRAGVDGDHETRLREKRVAKMVDLLTEAMAFREDAATSALATPASSVAAGQREVDSDG